MEKEFVPYELAVKLKKLGFVYECFGYYDCTSLENPELVLIKITNRDFMFGCASPLWQQAFDWFREKYKLKVGIGVNDKGLYYDYKIVLFNTTDVYYKDCYNTYTEARLACLEKLIELVENEKN